jgi:hypothetical protein
VSHSTTTNGGKGKPPTHARPPKAKRNNTGCVRWRRRKAGQTSGKEARKGKGGGKEGATHRLQNQCRRWRCESSWTGRYWRESWTWKTLGR